MRFLDRQISRTHSPLWYIIAVPGLFIDFVFLALIVLLYFIWAFCEHETVKLAAAIFGEIWAFHLVCNRALQWIWGNSVTPFSLFSDIFKNAPTPATRRRSGYHGTRPRQEQPLSDDDWPTVASINSSSDDGIHAAGPFDDDDLHAISSYDDIDTGLDYNRDRDPTFSWELTNDWHNTALDTAAHDSFSSLGDSFGSSFDDSFSSSSSMFD